MVRKKFKLCSGGNVYFIWRGECEREQGRTGRSDVLRPRWMAVNGRYDSQRLRILGDVIAAGITCVEYSLLVA
jgi:hypothetical protein